jgi:hypothetical protein
MARQGVIWHGELRGIGMLVVVLVVMWLFVDVCDDPEEVDQ